MRVTLNPPYQVVLDGRHYFGGDALDVDDSTARHWHHRGWVTLDPPPVEPETPAQTQGRAGVRARIREELRADPSRSNREIARAVGTTDKTVAAARAGSPQ